MTREDINNLSATDIKTSLDFSQKPGVDIQLKMAPAYRRKLIQENKMVIKENPRVAAVLILLYRQNHEWFFPMILRNTYKGVHSNQIGFPGGKVEKKDNGFAATAIRESQEEIKAIPEYIEILGDLTQLYIPPSHFMVHPYVGIYHHQPTFTPCDREVKKIIPVNLASFILDNNVVAIAAESNGRKTHVPAYQLPQGTQVWGASAMMLSEFYVFIKKSLNL